MIADTTDLGINILRAVEDQIRKEVDAVFDREKERIIQQLEDTRNEVVAKAAVRITRIMEVQTMSDRMVITIVKPEEPRP